MKSEILLLILAAMLLFCFTEVQAAGNCRAEGCGNSASTGSGYCVVHKCSHKGCQDQRMNASSYCRAHTCIEPDCYREANAEKTKCVLHRGPFVSSPFQSTAARNSTNGSSGKQTSKAASASSSKPSSKSSSGSLSKSSSKSSSDSVASYFAICEFPGCDQVHTPGSKYCSKHAWWMKDSGKSGKSSSYSSSYSSGSSKYKSI